jgi:aminomethyltransferase
VSKETAFYPRLAALTDDWTDLFGYRAPATVTDVLEEYRAVRDAAGLMDFSMLRKIDIDGPGALELVNGIVTRDLRTLEVGQIAYGALCDEDGKMVDDCTASLRSPDRIRFCGANDRDAEIFAAAAEGTDVTVRAFTDEMPHLCLQGPKSREMLQPLANRDLSNVAFPYYTLLEGVAIGGVPVFMNRLGYTAELGYELWVEAERALELWDVLIKATEPQGMKVIGMTALDLFRIEGGFIIGGVEYDPSVSPYECGLGWSVTLDKGDFQGRAGLQRDRVQTTQRLTSVVLESGGDAATDARLSIDGEDTGYVTQAVRSPHLGCKTLGLAKLPEGVAREVGTALTARIGGEDVAGEVVRHPVYDPERRRVKES